MEFLDLMSISHRYMELLNPSTPEKVLKLGKILGLRDRAASDIIYSPGFKCQVMDLALISASPSSVEPGLYEPIDITQLD